MNTWWKRALAVTVVWMIVSVGGGVLLASAASSQYAADRVLMFVGPAVALGLVAIWVTAYVLHKRR